MIAGFLLLDKLKKVWFFKKTFLLTETSIEVVLEISFLIFSNANIQFIEKKLIWRSYIAAKALLTTKRVELIDRKDFATIILDENKEIFILYIATLLAAPKMTIYLFQIAQIALLLAEKALVKVFS